MKKYFRFYSIITALLFIFFACAEDYKLDVVDLTADDVTLTAVKSTTSDNIYTFSVISKAPVTVKWNLGNEVTGSGTKITGTYIEKGTYTVKAVVSGATATVTKTVQVTIANDDFGLINTPIYTALTGGIENTAGKTWVVAQYLKAHFGIGPADEDTPSWWAAAPMDKEGTALYEQKYTFYQNGLKMKWENQGYVYTNEAGKNALGSIDTLENPGGKGDFNVKYVPKTDLYSFTLNESDMTLTLSDHAIFAHYAGTSTYEILSITENEMHLRYASTVQVGNIWYLILVPEDKNVAPPVVVKAVPLSEDFEGTTAKVVFKSEDMGTLSKVVDNPVPLPDNISDKVYRYQKSTAFYSNLSFTAPDYKFDLTTQNKIKVKVFIPSYNDYATENEIAGDWITNNKLLPQLAIKLQNSDAGDNAWQTQTQIIQTVDKDKWVELIFDFSTVSANRVYDKIVIQFGDEGHAGTGIFFFDDFQFTN